MVEIVRDAPYVTVINVFHVAPGLQDDAVARLLAVDDRIAKEPGWISASVHRAFDGSRIANYAQWRSQADIVAALRHPDLAPLLTALAQVGAGDWHLYEVVSADAVGAEPHR